VIAQIGRYVVRGELGKGGFGTVYRAWDPTMRRDVAIKVLTAVHEPAMLARFRTEPATTGRLKHKNIITVYDFGEHDSAPYLVMELLDGRSLQEAIKSGPALSVPGKVGILAEIARGLLYAHEQGVIHRDIKPANVMLLKDGGVKILDFGIARLMDPEGTRQTSTGMMIGTLEYMAPEQFEGKDATALSDIFAYGVVCYELLSGQQPFRASFPAAVIHKILNTDPEPLRTVAPQCPEALEPIVRKALAKRCSERYQSLQEILFDLAPIEAGFRKARVDAIAAEAERLFEAGELDSAQKEVRRALELDASHPPSQELRRRIQQRRERLALEERWKGAVGEAESLLQRKSFGEAIETLFALRDVLRPESVADLRADVERRLAAAKTAEGVAALLAEAQDAAGRADLPAVSRVVGDVLVLDPSNTTALELERWVAEEMARREQQRRDDLSKVRQVVREQIDAALRFDDAFQSIEVALQRYPGDPDLVALQSLVEVTAQLARRHITPMWSRRSPPAQPLVAGATKVNPKDGLTYVWVPPGTFQMGASPGDNEADSSEKPAH
jgi:serine/threonine-protein kinase